MSKRIVVVTFGSLGDLYPFLAIAQGLQARGHDVLVASLEPYRRKVIAAGLAFEPFRASWDIVRSATDPDHRHSADLFSEIGVSYENLSRVVAGADVLVAHSAVFAAPLVAAKAVLPLVSGVLQPIAFFSAYEPLVFSLAPGGGSASWLESRFWVNLWQGISWAKATPVRQLRVQLGLSGGTHPLFKDFAEAGLILALFSPLLAAPRPDWPPQTRTTGFAFYPDPAEDDALPPPLAQFLDSGAPPVVFTLGSSSLFENAAFYEIGATAARLTGRRAVLVSERPETTLFNFRSDTIVVPYAPFQKLFARSAAVVLHGGIGTAALALRAGCPMLLVPHDYDQPDTAARLARLGVARVIRPERYTALAVAAELFHLLNNRYYSVMTSEVSRLIRAEDGVGAACDAIEQFTDRAGC